MVPVMLTVVGAALRPASVTVTAGVTRLVTAFFAASVCVNRAASATASSATTAPKINMTRRGVSHDARAGAPALTGVSARSSHEMLI
jgi:hypothetical protein